MRKNAELVLPGTKVIDDPQSITEHHRKPTSIGGDYCEKRNISWVECYRHQAWHALYINNPAEVIIERFRDDYDIFGSLRHKPRLQKSIYEEWIRGNSCNLKRQGAWEILFKDLSLEDIVRQINGIWIDPDYEIRFGTSRVLSFNLAARPCVTYSMPHLMSVSRT